MYRLLSISLVCLLALAILPTVAYTLQQEGDKVYLAHNGKRLLVREKGKITLYNNETLTVKLSEGTMLSLPGVDHNESDITAIHSGKVIAQVKVKDLKDEWLKDDIRWGGHSDANEVRNMATGGGGVGFKFSCPIVQGQSTLAIMTWYYLGPSFTPIAREFLVCIRVKPKFTFDPVRVMERVEHEYSGSPYLQVPRLFHTKAGDIIFRNKIVNVTPPPNSRQTLHGELVLLSAKGNAVKVIVRLPGHLLPDGIVDWRWIVLKSMRDKDAKPIWVYDTVRKTLKPLPGRWGEYPYIRYTINGTRLLIQHNDAKGNDVITLISVYNGNHSMYKIPNGESQHIEWQNIIVAAENYTAIVVYDAGWHRLAVCCRTGSRFLRSRRRRPVGAGNIWRASLPRVASCDPGLSTFSPSG